MKNTKLGRRKSVDFEEFFPSAMKKSSICAVHSLATTLDMEIETYGCKDNLSSQGLGQRNLYRPVKPFHS